VSNSYPTIQDSLSEIQQEFMGCVEMHLDPPDTDSTSYRVEALYRHRSDDPKLPGNAIRFAVSVDETGEDISERRHTIEFLSLGEDDREVRLGHIRHSMKRVEASQGRLFWTESQFQVAGPGVPGTQASQEDVEQEVEAYVERLKALDQGHELVQIQAV
jgi:hypothetical protein